MRRTYRSKAIVLSKTEFGEADLYVQLLTKEFGVISALAKSARKSKRRYVGGLDMFCHNDVTLRGDPRNNPYLLELSVLNSFTELRKDLERMLVGGKLVQWVRNLVHGPTPVPGIYSLLGQTLALIEKETDPVRLDTLWLLFKARLLSQLGIQPRVGNCAGCGEGIRAPYLFDIPTGGTLCDNCFRKGGPKEVIQMKEESRQFLEGADKIRLKEWSEFRFPANQLPQLQKTLTAFASFHGHARLP